MHVRGGYLLLEPSSTLLYPPVPICSRLSHPFQSQCPALLAPAEKVKPTHTFSQVEQTRVARRACNTTTSSAKFFSIMKNQVFLIIHMTSIVRKVISAAPWWQRKEAATPSHPHGAGCSHGVFCVFVSALSVFFYLFIFLMVARANSLGSK